MKKVLKTLRVEKASTRTWGQLTLSSLMFFLFLISISTSVFGQIETMYSLYRFNPQVLTPAHVGSTVNSEMILMHRNQWVGIEGAPRNVGFSGNFKWGQKKGLGLTAMLDEAGPVRSTLIGGDFAYHINLSEGWNLDGGIRMGLANISLNFSQIRLVNSNDNLFAGDRSTGIQPNLGYGFRIAKKDDGFFFSFSQPRVLKYDFGTYSGAFRDVAYYYAMAGTKIGLGGKVETPNGLRSRVTLYPSVLFRLATDVPLSYDVNLTANLKGKLDVGLSYRREDSYGLRLGVQATKKIYLGYVFELPISDIRKASSQTHEIGIRFFIFDKVKQKKDELMNEDSERSNRNQVVDFGPYVKKEQAETTISEASRKIETVQEESKTIASKTEEVKQEVKATQTSVAPQANVVKQETSTVTTTAQNTMKEDAEEIKNAQASKPASATNATSNTSSTANKTSSTTNISSTNTSSSTTTTVSSSQESEEDYEYVTVTKTRVVRTTPKVTNKTVTSTQRTQGAAKQVASGAIRTSTQTKANTSTAVNRTAANTAKAVAKKKSVEKKRTQTASTNAGPVDPNAPKVTRRRISNNITETTVEKKGGSETQVGADGSQQVTKRKRKDGSEETIYTTTEVVKKKKEIK